ncbi:MAG: hypothetical protein D4R68_07795 [Ignavibacteriales bacterium]|nr:MAG: hypothetical protein D4R68_07795 [Ignavibacteriales bacterium]
MKTKPFIIPILFLLISVSSIAQIKTNLDVIYKLIDRSVSRADSILGTKQTINLSFTSSPILEVLKPKIFQTFNEHGYLLTSSTIESNQAVNYTVTSLKVEYRNPFSDGLFGGLLLYREISFNYSLTITRADKTIKSLSYIESQIDTVKFDEISRLENQMLPFTQSSIPSTPLLSNLWEPIIVIGTLIVTIVLLFSIRGK